MNTKRLLLAVDSQIQMVALSLTASVPVKTSMLLTTTKATALTALPLGCLLGSRLQAGQFAAGLRNIASKNSAQFAITAVKPKRFLLAVDRLIQKLGSGRSTAARVGRVVGRLRHQIGKR